MRNIRSGTTAKQMIPRRRLPICILPRGSSIPILGTATPVTLSRPKHLPHLPYVYRTVKHLSTHLQTRNVLIGFRLIPSHLPAQRKCLGLSPWSWRDTMGPLELELGTVMWRGNPELAGVHLKSLRPALRGNHLARWKGLNLLTYAGESCKRVL
jgi:hypothetical protein